MTKQRVVIGGASGLIGTALVSFLEQQGFDVVRLVRHDKTNEGEVFWNPQEEKISSDVISGAFAVINLSGASVAKLPWTNKYRRTMLNSRLCATNTLTSAIARAEVPPKVFISASACGYYGDEPGKNVTESSGQDADSFLGKLVGRWEKAAQKASPYCRVVTLRNATVLAKGKGGIAPFEFLGRLFVMPVIGGSQFWPWVSLTDMVRIIHFLLISDLSGPVNASSPTPNTMLEVMKALGRAIKRPVWLRLPRWSAYIAGSGGHELLALNQKIVPEKLINAGFEFEHPTIDEAFENIYRKK